MTFMKSFYTHSVLFQCHAITQLAQSLTVTNFSMNLVIFLYNVTVHSVTAYRIHHMLAQLHVQRYTFD